MVMQHITIGRGTTLLLLGSLGSHVLAVR